MVEAKDVIIAFLFILFGVIGAVSQRWQTEIVVIGNHKNRAHIFDHFFLLWFLQQVLQACLLFWRIFIDKDWFGCGRLKHWEVKPRAHQHQNVIGLDNDNAQAAAQADGDNRGNNPDDDVIGNDERDPLLVNEARGDAAVAVGADNIIDLNGAPVGGQNAVVMGNDNVPVPVNDQLPVPQQRRRDKRKHTKWLFLPPAIFFSFYMLMTYFGIKLTLHSSFIMLKGSEALFTALLSIAFLAQNYLGYMRLGIFFSIAGFACSGLSDYIHRPPNGGYEKYGIAAGDLLLVMAQICSASKAVYEERFIKKHSIHPMRFLGWEGVYGCVMSLICLIVFNFLPAAQYSDPPSNTMEDVKEAFLQMSNSRNAILASLGYIVASVLYYYFGLFLVRDHGALARVMIETLIWAAYWAIVVTFHWEHFFIAQIPGLVAIPIGLLIFFHIVPICCLSGPENLVRNGENIYAQGPAVPYNALPQNGNFPVNGDAADEDENGPGPVLIDQFHSDSDGADDGDEPLLGAVGGIPAEEDPPGQNGGQYGVRFDEPMLT